MYSKIEFSELNEIHLRLKHTPDDATITRVYSFHNTRQIYLGKHAYVKKPGSYDTPKREICCYCLDHIGQDLPYKLLYVDPASKISRDVLRNNGYKITYDRNKADCIILPKPDSVPEMTVDFYFVDGDHLYVVLVERSNLSQDDPWIVDDIKGCEDWIVSEYGLGDASKIFHSQKLNEPLVPTTLYFVKKCESYDFILTNEDRYRYNFCYDTNVCLPGSTKIDSDTLVLWSRMKDYCMLEKTILQSDWQKYPCTIAVMLWRGHSDCKYQFSQAGRVMLDAIDYDILDRMGTLGPKLIQPEDWNMLQAFIMKSVGAGENGGFVKNVSPYNNLVRTRVATAPLKIDKPEMFKTLITLVQES